jgi:23S rRNA (adenine2503-C2)-methyltransferase
LKPPAHHIFHFTLDELREWFARRGLPHFRAAQLLEWVYAKGVTDPGAMTNFSKPDRELLAREMVFLSGRTVREQLATDGTRKLLIEWDDPSSASAVGGVEAAVPAQPTPSQLAGEGAASRVSLPLAPSDGLPGPGGDSSRQTECVMIPTDDRRTACVSSQVGCPVGCRFCASGLGGLDGNLTAGRIVEQAWRLGRQLAEAGDEAGRVTNIVFMGMGEPLSNFQNVTRAVRVLNAPWGMGIGGRRITISTVGLPKAIEKLAEQLDVPVTLALSLHAPNDRIRRELIPWAEYTTIAELLGACRKWFERTGREITLEYTLLRGVNDSVECADELAGVARTLRANINLIRYNEVEGLPFKRPRDEDVLAFQEVLRERRVNTHIRASRGRDIAAACGQLRHESGAKARRDAGAAS